MSARIDGIDLSHWQDGPIDLAQAHAAGVKFVIHKATEGTTYTDPSFDTRRRQVARTPIVFGAYHFAQSGDPIAQARHFLAVAQPKPGDMRPVLDLEVAAFGDMSTAARSAWVAKWVAVVREATGVTPLIYTPFDLSSDCGCRLWVARYSNGMYPPRIPAPWKGYAIWQFSDGTYGTPRTVPGVGHCDINTLGHGVQLSDLRIPKETPVPKPTTRTRVEKARPLLVAAADLLEATPRRRIVCHAQARAIRRVLRRLPRR